MPRCMARWGGVTANMRRDYSDSRDGRKGRYCDVEDAYCAEWHQLEGIHANIAESKTIKCGLRVPPVGPDGDLGGDLID